MTWRVLPRRGEACRSRVRAQRYRCGRRVVCRSLVLHRGVGVVVAGCPRDGDRVDALQLLERSVQLAEAHRLSGTTPVVALPHVEQPVVDPGANPDVELVGRLGLVGLESLGEHAQQELVAVGLEFVDLDDRRLRRRHALVVSVLPGEKHRIVHAVDGGCFGWHQVPPTGWDAGCDTAK